MIQIYSKENTNFEANGDSVLFPESCKVEGILNGMWELQMEHPLDEEGRYKLIETGAVISAPSFVSEKQLFRIYNTEKTDETVVAYARPIFFDSQEDCFLLNKRPTEKNGQEALDILMEGTIYSGSSNITDVRTAYYVRKNLIEALAGKDSNSFLNLWGGEMYYDNFNVVINERIGADNGVQALFGRNITGISENINMDGVITRIIPIAFNGYMLEGDEPWVDSPYIDHYAHPYIQEVKFENIKLQADCTGDETGFASLEELREELIRQCELMYEGGCDRPTCNYTVEIVDLAQTEEYKDYVQLETISLGDTIECEYEPLNISTKARVIRILYDCIKKRNDSVELGDFSFDYFSEINKKNTTFATFVNNNGTINAERIQGVLNGGITQLRYQKTVAQKQDVRAILFEDTDPDSELYGAMCLGTQGFQIAKERLADDSDWDWSTAFTAKGGFANVLVAGILSDKTGKSYWNLDTGEFVLSGNTDIGGKTVEEIIEASADAGELAENFKNWCHEEDATYIDGGKIYTGSITAKQIDVDDLYAEKGIVIGSPGFSPPADCNIKIHAPWDAYQRAEYDCGSVRYYQGIDSNKDGVYDSSYQKMVINGGLGRISMYGDTPDDRRAYLSDDEIVFGNESKDVSRTDANPLVKSWGGIWTSFLKANGMILAGGVKANSISTNSGANLDTVNTFLGRTVTSITGTYLLNTVRLTKRAGVVTVQFNGFKNIPSQKSTLIGTLPEGYRPYYSTFFDCTCPDGQIYRMFFANTGEITVYWYSSATSGQANACSAFTFTT